MLGLILVSLGGAAMFFGAIMLNGWVSGKSRWFDAGVYDRQGESKNDRQFLDIYFMAMVIAPLLGGALLIVFGLAQWR